MLQNIDILIFKVIDFSQKFEDKKDISCHLQLFIRYILNVTVQE